MSAPIYLYYFRNEGVVKASHEPPYSYDLQAIDELNLKVIRALDGVAEEYEGSGFVRPAEVAEIRTSVMEDEGPRHL